MTLLETRPVASVPGGANAIGRMLGLVGDEWTLLILRQLLLGDRRYGQLISALPISHAVLTGRLVRLEEQGLLQRHVYQHNPVRAEYVPSNMARAFWPVLASLWAWEQRWVVTPDTGELPVMQHAVCGAVFTPELACGACHGAADAHDVAATWGPSGTWERSIPEGSTRRRGPAAQRDGRRDLLPETMLILGNRWSSALMGAAFRGITRFSDFAQVLSVPPTILAERIGVFCQIGVFEARSQQLRPERDEYVLTDKGLAFFPVVITSIHWADQWLRAPEGAALVLTHETCGSTFVPYLRCDRCTSRLRGSQLDAVAPPVEGDADV